MKATLEIPDSDAKLPLVFEAELADTINDRASYDVTHTDGVTVFTVTAKDTVALRATVNAITKQLVVYDKMCNVE